MEFKLSELQQDIANLAKDFAEKKLAPTVKERDEKEVFDRAILDEMGTLGLLGIPWEEENGGVGADFLSLAVACEEVAKVDPSIALSFEVHTMLCSWPIWKFGTAEQKAKFLKPLAEGTKLGAFGLTEPNAGTDALNEDKPRGQMLIDMTKKYNADAVVICMMRFCDPEEFDYPIYKPEFEAAGVRYTVLDLDIESPSLEQLRTRIQAFSEIL